MPSRRPILTDIHDLNLDPQQNYRKTKRNGRLKELEQEIHEEVIKQELSTNIVKNALTFLPEVIVEPVVQPESNQQIIEIIDDLIDIKQQSVELLNLEQEQLTNDMKNSSESSKLPTKKIDEKVEQTNEKKKKFVKNLKSNMNS